MHLTYLSPCLEQFFIRKSEGNQNGGMKDGHSVWNRGK
jgi:hypothetical protein